MQTIEPGSLEAEFQQLTNYYKFREAKEVFLFLKKNPFLVQILKAAPAEICKYFANQTLFLEVIRDAENKAEVHLTLFIATSLEAEQALEKFDRLFYDWWLKNLTAMPESKRGILNLNLEFQ